MKVLHLATSLTNGAGKAARRINESVNEVGLESKIMTSGRVEGCLKANEIGLAPGETTKLFSKSVTLLQRSIIEKSNFPLTPISIESLNLKEHITNQYDILSIHASYNLLSINSISYLLKLGKPIVVTLHDERFYTGGCHNTLDCNNFQESCEKCPIATNLGRRVVKNAFGRELAVLRKNTGLISIVAPSYWIKSKAESSLKLQGFQIVQISNPVPATIYCNQGSGTNPFRSLNKITLGFIAANLENPFKGLEKLIEAIKLMDAKERENYRILLVGQMFQGKPTIPLETEYFNVSEDADVAEILRAVDLLVVPSLGDNSPSVISEAQMSGTKVIGSHRGGIPEMLSHDASLLFNPDLPSSILGKIRLNSGTYQRSAIAESASLRYSYQTVGSEYRKHYEGLLNPQKYP